MLVFNVRDYFHLVGLYPQGGSFLFGNKNLIFTYFITCQNMRAGNKIVNWCLFITWVYV